MGHVWGNFNIYPWQDPNDNPSIDPSTGTIVGGPDLCDTAINIENEAKALSGQYPYDPRAVNGENSNWFIWKLLTDNGLPDLTVPNPPLSPGFGRRNAPRTPPKPGLPYIDGVSNY